MITLTTQPDTIVTAQRPINFVATSDKYDVINLTSVAITDNGSGKCRFTKTSHGLIEDDIIFVTGSALAAYNVKHEITVVNANVFDSNIDYSINSTVSVERNNPNFQLKAEFYHFNNTRNAITGVTNAGGGNVQVTTIGSHGYLVTDIISIEDTGDYDGAYIPVSIDGIDRFTVTKAYTSTKTGNTRKGAVISTKVQRYGSDFTFDVSGAAKSKLSYSIPTLSGVALRIEDTKDNSIIHFAILFTEQHDNYSGILTGYNTKLSNKIQAVNVCLQHEETQNMTAFIITNGASTTLRFLTDMTKTIYHKGSEWIALPFVTNSNKSLYVQAARYPGPLSLSTVSNVVGGYGVVMYQMSTTATYVELTLLNGSTDEVSETITIQRIEKCQDSKRFWFQSRRGGMDVFNVFGLEDKINNSNKQGYYRQLESGYSVSERGNTIIKSVAESQYQLYGQFINEGTAIWLEQLFSSPEVYLESSTNLIPIDITDGNNKSIDNIEPRQIIINYQKSNKIEQL